MNDIDALFEGAPRFRTARVTVHHRADWDVYRRVLERHRSNPAVAEMLDRVSPRAAGIHEHVWRVWIERPFRRRVEDLRSPVGPVDVSVVTADDSGRSEGIAMMTLEGGRELTRTELVEMDRSMPLFHRDVHPMVAELLDPRDLLFSEIPDRPETTPTLEIVGGAELLGRPVARVRVQVHDWQTREPISSENLWVADDYELLIDEQTGVVLRFACRADGAEFSVREMTEAVFDEPIDPSMWEPPADVPQKPYTPLLHRLFRRLRGRHTRRSGA